MHPKLACSDFTFPLLSHKDVLDLIKMLRIKAVDIGLMQDRSHLQPATEFRNVAKSARALKKRLDDRGLKASDIFLLPATDAFSMAINNPLASRRRKVRKWFECGLEYAARVGARHLTSTPGIHFKEESLARSWGNSCHELAWCIEKAKSYGISFGVEPHLGSMVGRPRSALRFVKAVPGLTYTLDYSHFTRIGIADAQVEPLLSHASHFHVRGSRKGALQSSFADNAIDFGRIVKVMAKIGYRGYMTIEYVRTEWEDCLRVDNLSETILFRDFLQATV